MYVPKTLLEVLRLLHAHPVTGSKLYLEIIGTLER